MRIPSVVAGTSMAHDVRWYVEGELHAEKKTWDDKAVVKHDDGQLVVRYSGLGAPRRATLYGLDEDAGARTGLGGVDLVPEPGSRTSGAGPPTSTDHSPTGGRLAGRGAMLDA